MLPVINFGMKTKKKSVYEKVNTENEYQSYNPLSSSFSNTDIHICVRYSVRQRLGAGRRSQMNERTEANNIAVQKTKKNREKVLKLRLTANAFIHFLVIVHIAAVAPSPICL